jgi:hypothetical protein
MTDPPNWQKNKKRRTLVIASPQRSKQSKIQQVEFGYWPSFATRCASRETFRLAAFL